MAAGCTQEEAAARAALLDVQSYQVFLDLTGDQDLATSRTEIRFRCREPGAATYADLAAATVGRVELNGVSLDPGTTVTAGRVRLDGLAADNVLAVDAQVSCAEDARALTLFRDPSDGTQYLLATCFPTSAPDVFCCFDQPDLPADLTLSVAAPAGWECVAGGEVVARPAPGTAGVWRFATIPAKPYELVLVAGPYLTTSEDEIRGAGEPVRLTVRCRPRLAGEPGLARVSGVVRRAVEYYERLLGVVCPYPKNDIVATPRLGAKAMQVPGMTLISETLVQEAADPGADFGPLVLAHEAAHLWFGGLVDGRWWDDMWLAEGMASYLAPLAGQHALGLDAAWATFSMDDKARACQADQAPGVLPVTSPVRDAGAGMSRPVPITYCKAAAVVRQLAALIGDDALRAGLRDYLTRYGGGAATTAELMDCWARASGRDLDEWAGQWLRTPGLNTLRPELTLGPDGTVASLAVVQEPPPAEMTGEGGPVLRTHRIAAGLYHLDGGRLHRRGQVTAEISGTRTELPGLAGTTAPDAVVLDDSDLTLARIRFDAGSLRALAACTLDLGDPLTEAVCWNAIWDMTTAAELPAAEFITLVTRRLGTGRPGSRPPAGLGELLGHAVTGADYYAPPGQRARLRERLADAALARAGTTPAGSHARRMLTAGYARSADSPGQLGLLRRWLAGQADKEGSLSLEQQESFPLLDVDLKLDLRWAVLRALSRRGLAADGELAAAADADPVAGDRQRATCRALRPEPAAKEAAWVTALAAGTPGVLARAHAEGVWVPGQEGILVSYRDRYFAEALPAAMRRTGRDAVRLARLLYPATLADPATLVASDGAAAGGGLSDPVRQVLLEEGARLRRVIAARELVGAAS